MFKVLYETSMDIPCVFIFLLAAIVLGNGQLIVNVKDKGGDVLQESIYANTTTDTITLEFMKFDGTLITQFIDFPNVSISSITLIACYCTFS